MKPNQQFEYTQAALRENQAINGNAFASRSEFSWSTSAMQHLRDEQSVFFSVQLGAICCVLLAAGCRRQSPPSAACIDLPAWSRFGFLFARNVEGPGSDFLLLHLTESNLDWKNPDPSASTGGMIYRYVVADGEVRPASPDDWKSALGQVTEMEPSVVMHN